MFPSGSIHVTVALITTRTHVTVTLPDAMLLAKLAKNVLLQLVTVPQCSGLQA